MVSVNEQSSPILDVEHGPARSEELCLTVVLGPGSALYNIFERYSNLFFTIYFLKFRNIFTAMAMKRFTAP